MHGTQWLPNAGPRAIVQLFHGLGEHHLRYARFATGLTAQHLLLVAHDHRGHGAHTETPGWFAENDGWQTLSDDALLVTQYIEAQYPGLPIILFGHSMGSYVAQSFAMQHSDRLAALVLSASTWPEAAKLTVGRWLAAFEAWRHGAMYRSPLLHKIGFGDFNKRFEPARTALDWLSGDAAEVDRYIADPLCGGPYTCGLWLDLLHGLGDIGNASALALIRSDLPILLTGGAADPVGGERGIGKLARHYRDSGHGAVTVQIYPDGRHEMLNETNRDEFTLDVIAWMDSTLSKVTDTN